MKHEAAQFEPSLISGYLDGELTQADAQRVRLRLEDDAEARAIYEEMKRMREATISTEFKLPADDQWDERPRGGLSLLSRGLGWLMVILWTLGLTAFTLWQVAVSAAGLLPKLLVFGAFSGFGLLLVSVLLDRLRTAPGDRYRRVEK